MSQKGITALVFLALLGLVCAGIVGGSFYIKYKQPQLLKNLKSTKLKSSIVPKEILPSSMIMGFLSREGDSNKFYLYDITLKKFLDTDKVILQGKNPLFDMGPYSPDGRYLPIQAITEGSDTEDFYYFYDVINNKAIQVLSTRDYISLFGINTKWIDDNSFVYSSNYDSNSNTLTELVVDAGGKTETRKVSNSIIYVNKRIKQEIIIGSNRLPASIKVTVDGKLVIESVQGSAVGIMDNFLVTLDEAQAQSDSAAIDPNDPNKFKDPELQKKVENAKSEAEKIEIITQALQKPAGDSYLRVYSLTDGKLKNSIKISTDGWIAVDAQIKNDSKTIIVHEQDKKLIGPFTSRYVEINLQNPDQINKLFESSGILPATVQLGGGETFELTQDSKWIIYYKPSQEKNILGENYIIIFLRNLATGEEKAMCNLDCRTLRIYNPERLRRL